MTAKKTGIQYLHSSVRAIKHGEHKVLIFSLCPNMYQGTFFNPNVDECPHGREEDMGNLKKPSVIEAIGPILDTIIKSEMIIQK